MSGPKTPGRAGKAVIWAGDLKGGVVVRERLRANGFSATLIDANEFHRDGRVAYIGDILVFVGARNHVEIEAAYAAVGFKGEVTVLGVDGNPVPSAANTAMSPAARREPTRQQVEAAPPAPPPPPPAPPVETPPASTETAPDPAKESEKAPDPKPKREPKA